MSLSIERRDRGAAAGGVFHDDVGQFDRIVAQHAGVFQTPEAIRAIEAPWYQGRNIVRVPVSRIRRLLMGDTDLPAIQENLNGIDISPIEAHQVTAAACCQHGDLHCANAVFDQRCDSDFVSNTRRGQVIHGFGTGDFLSPCEGKARYEQTAAASSASRPLVSSLRRWVRRGVVKGYFVEWGGKPVQSIKVGFKRAIVLSGVKGKVAPHTLRHTAATRLMQAGVPIWEAAGFLGMSADMVERTYGHHHPAHMRGAADAIGR